MLNKFIQTILVAIALCFSAGSYAGIITDVVSVDEKMSRWDNRYTTWLHNINDDGFVLGTAVAGYLSIDIWDDQDNYRERARFYIGWPWSWDDGNNNGNSDYTTYLDYFSLAIVNFSGYLNVTVRALRGDFYVGDSTLTIYTKDNRAVPEPGSLALLGLGLIGLGIQRRITK